MPFYNDEKDPFNFPDAKRNRTPITRVPQGQHPDALPGTEIVGKIPGGGVLLSMNAFHANALSSCAMNALGIWHYSMNLLPIWVTDYVPLSVGEVRERFSVFAGTSAPCFLSRRPCADFSTVPLDSVACLERSAREELGCRMAHFSAFACTSVPCISEAMHTLRGGST